MTSLPRTFGHVGEKNSHVDHRKFRTTVETGKYVFSYGSVPPSPEYINYCVDWRPLAKERIANIKFFLAIFWVKIFWFLGIFTLFVPSRKFWSDDNEPFTQIKKYIYTLLSSHLIGSHKIVHSVLFLRPYTTSFKVKYSHDQSRTFKGPL